MKIPLAASQLFPLAARRASCVSINQLAISIRFNGFSKFSTSPKVGFPLLGAFKDLGRSTLGGVTLAGIKLAGIIGNCE